jgi:hypothetical protein
MEEIINKAKNFLGNNSQTKVTNQLFKREQLLTN